LTLSSFRCKNSIFATIFCAVASASLVNAGPILAQQDTVNSNVFCKRDSTVSIAEYPKTSVPDGYSDLKIYELDSDFRSPKGDTPWSESKIFKDPVTGSYPGVIDRNYIPNASRIHTIWYRDLIMAEGLEISPYFFKRYQFDVLMIPSGDKYFVLRGCNGRFPVDARVAAVLSSMPKDKEIFVKLYTPEFSGAILNKIGSGTVNAWKKVYASWSKDSTPRPQELGF
jgi:hypothetical protein